MTKVLKFLGWSLMVLAFAVTPITWVISTATAADRSIGPDAAWDNALVVLPGGKSMRMPEAISSGALKSVPPNVTTVLYMHGCEGIAPHDAIKLGKEAGFLVISPDSMARAGRVSNCPSGPGKYGNFPAFGFYRQEEIKYSLKMMRQLNINPDRFAIMGHSEGGHAVANWSGNDFRAAIMTGHNCHTKDSFYEGVKLPKTTPVMNIVSKNDNWVATHNKADSCAPYLKDHAIKVVINPEGTAHWMNDKYFQDIVKFIRDNTK